MTLPPDTSLEGRIKALEAQMTALRTNLLQGASVQDASGRFVTVANLAFGQVAAATAAGITLTGVASSVGSVAYVNDQGPYVDVRVTGGRCRVDVAAGLEVYGNKCSLFIGYQVLGPSVDLAGVATAAQFQAPAFDRSAQLQDDGVGQNQLGAFGIFDLVTGMPAGYYRIRQAYSIAYSSTTGAPYGIATYRRIAATPY